MIRLFVFLFFALGLLPGTGNAPAHLSITPKTGYPENLFTDRAQKDYAWIINGRSFNYQEGRYDLNLHSRNCPDTVLFIDRWTNNVGYTLNGVYIQTKNNSGADTTRYYCRFNAGEEYKLSQSWKGNAFELFSLDSFGTRIHYDISIAGVPPDTTLWLYISGLQPYEIRDDFKLSFDFPNTDWKRSTQVRFELYNEKQWSLFSEDAETPGQKALFDFTYIFMGNEYIAIDYAFNTGLLNIKYDQ